MQKDNGKKAETETQSVALSVESWEILKALACGLELQKFPEGWAFVGKWQEPSTSGVSLNAVGALFEAGLIASKFFITDIGIRELKQHEKDLFESALSWVQSNDLIGKIC